MMNNGQVWTFMAMFAPEVPVLHNFNEMCQVWNRVASFDEDVQIGANMANYGIWWPAMLKYGQLWLEKSRLINSIAVSAIPKNADNECKVSAFKPQFANNGGMWSEKATKCSVCLVIA